MSWPPDRRRVVAALGVAQLIGWGTSFYFPGVLAAPIAADTGWPLSMIVGGVSLGLLIAGLISPQVGHVIALRGGRPVLAASSLSFAAGMCTIGLAPSLWVYLGGWIVVGAAMGTGLYDAAFAALGRLYGSTARGPITALTLFGGFAGTVFWPLGAFLAATFGWRNACFAYAALHLLIALPLVLTFPAGKAAPSDDAVTAAAPTTSPTPRAGEGAILVLLALILTLSAGIGSIIVVHLLLILEARGLAVAVAVSIGTLFGADRYPVLMGRLAFPSLIVQALAPFAAALIVERYGIDAMVVGLSVIAAINAILVALLWWSCSADNGPVQDRGASRD